MFSEGEFSNKLPSQTAPEILNADLSTIVMLLLDWGVSRPEELLQELPFVDPPTGDALQRALSLLNSLGAVEELDGGRRVSITDHGRAINKLPMHARLATCIVRASTEAELAIAVITAALLDSDAPVSQGRTTADLSIRVEDVLSDEKSAKSIGKYAAKISSDALDAVKKIIGEQNFRTDAIASLGISLLPGFSDLVAQEIRSDNGGSIYKLALGRNAKLFTDSSSPEYSVVVETATGDDGNARITTFAPIDRKSIANIAEEITKVYTEPTKGHEVRARRVICIGDIELSSNPLPSPPADEVASVLLDAIRRLGGVSDALLKPLPKSKREEVEVLRDRVRLAYDLSAEEEREFFSPHFAALDAQERGEGDETDALLLEELVEPWLGACLSLASVDLYEILVNALGGMERQIDEIVPQRIEAPDGFSIRITYADGVPLASGKLQQFFGTTESPMIGSRNNRIPVTLSLLSPAGKPLAQTQDLAFFWKEAYPQVRAEMRGRYPKHPWPEDPMSAKATRNTNKQERAKNA